MFIEVIDLSYSNATKKNKRCFKNLALRFLNSKNKNDMKFIII